MIGDYLDRYVEFSRKRLEIPETKRGMEKSKALVQRFKNVSCLCLKLVVGCIANPHSIGCFSTGLTAGPFSLEQANLTDCGFLLMDLFLVVGERRHVLATCNVLFKPVFECPQIKVSHVTVNQPTSLREHTTCLSLCGTVKYESFPCVFQRSLV